MEKKSEETQVAPVRYARTDVKSDNATKQKPTLILPFSVLAALLAPSLFVIMLAKPTAGFKSLELSGLLGFLQFAMGLTLVVMSVCAVMYLIRARGIVGRLVVLLVQVALWIGFGYVIS